jgi:hypothetical protein
MPVKLSKKLAIIQRRQRVADLYVQGWTQMQICEAVGISQPTVCDDLKRIRQEWRDSAIRNFDEARDRELQKLDRLEREAWDAWERSKKPQQSAVVHEQSGQQTTHKTLHNRVGDPPFLDQISRCIAQRRALLGLDAIPSMTEPDANGTIALDVRRERVVAILAGLCDRQRIGDAGTGPGPIIAGHVCHDDQPGQVSPSQAPGLP